jgi:NapC/NirT cytochrome c family protein
VLRLAGAVLTTVSAVLFLVVFFADLFGLHTNPYLGVIFFLILPGLFVLGLVLFAIGHWPASWPRIDLNNPAHRTTFLIVSILTLVNIVIVSMAAYRGIEYVDSVAFCGQVCHTVMQPEFVAHQTGSHANVKCIDCHAGPGAMSFASAKAAGTRRVLAVLRGTYATPIVPEPKQLPMAVQTCEQCHSSARFRGERIQRIVEYADNEKNAPSETKLKVDLRRVHTHIEKGIEFVATDKTRQTIPYVRMKEADGSWREYTAGPPPQPAAASARQPAQGSEWRRLDCMDCHNRPSHAIAPTPDRAVNDAMTAGVIPVSLPFVHREAIRALKAGNPAALRDFYRSGPRDQVDRAVAGVQDIYRRNVFPSMNVTFGSYPNNIGHIDSPGCFRCHDDDHKSKDGRKIGQDCETCHAIE